MKPSGKIASFTSKIPPAGPVFVGIDPSLTGFAICAVDAMAETYRAVVYTSSEKGTHRLYDISQFLLWFLAPYESVNNVALEGTVRQSPSASVLGELSGVVKVSLFSTYWHIPLEVPPTMVKKYCSGSGGKMVTKSQILLAVYRKWGVEFSDDNAADAYVLARIAAGVSNSAYESEVLRKLSDPKFRM